MKKKVKPESFIKQPTYSGGKKALDEFIKTNLEYPEEAVKNKVSGSVKLKFDIDVFGNVKDVSIIHGIGYGCDEEAIRLVKLLKYEKKKYRGLFVVFHQSMFIHFRLPNVPVQTVNDFQVQYEYTESKKSNIDSNKNPTITYTITTDKE